MMKIHWLAGLSMVLSAACAHAAAPRASWVTQKVYAYNHPYAAQLPQELATKMQKMSAGAFAFYRGTAPLFFEDMKTRGSADLNNATSRVWLAGDLHVQNLGGFRDADGNDVFDVSDFDEGYWGPYTWDVWRMAASLMLAAKEQGISAADRDAVVNTFVDAYLDQLANFKGNDGEKTTRLTASNTSGVVKDTIQAASGKSRSSLLAKYSSVTSGQRKFLTTSELQPVTSARYSAIAAAMSAYVSSIASSKRYGSSYYNLKDVRLRLGAGIGSLGRYRYYLLIEGPSSSTSDDVILEMKQAAASAVGIANPGGFPAASYGNHEGSRVVLTTKAQLSNTDVLTGWTTVEGLPFALREKQPNQEDFDTALLTSTGKWQTAAGYIGKAVAKIHALADKDYDTSLISASIDKEITDITAGNSSGFKAEVLSFAKDYAQQVEYDYQAFLAAYNSGATLY